jgi:hypothetical protein
MKRLDETMAWLLIENRDKANSDYCLEEGVPELTMSCITSVLVLDWRRN